MILLLDEFLPKFTNFTRIIIKKQQNLFFWILWYPFWNSITHSRFTSRTKSIAHTNKLINSFFFFLFFFSCWGIHTILFRGNANQHYVIVKALYPSLHYITIVFRLFLHRSFNVGTYKSMFRTREYFTFDTTRSGYSIQSLILYYISAILGLALSLRGSFADSRNFYQVTWLIYF